MQFSQLEITFLVKFLCRLKLQGPHSALANERQLVYSCDFRGPDVVFGRPGIEHFTMLFCMSHSLSFALLYLFQFVWGDGYFGEHVV